ncbi:MAG: DUF1501 domain-containing protein [Alphaproteobacteria bacterium]|nr:DUF1501 domain-containing protein [Alphaproteobacteria bacterium]
MTKNRIQGQEMEVENPQRRRFLKAGAAVGATFGASLALGNPLLPTKLAFAALPSDRKTIFIQLKGGLDQMALFPPVGDPAYAAARKSLALPNFGAPRAPIKLTNLFGLHPMAEALLPFWTRKELAVAAATGNQFADGSHFSAQEILENGYGRIGGDGSGWMGRMLRASDATPETSFFVGEAMPLLLQEPGGTSRATLVPAPTLSKGHESRLSVIHNHDLLLGPALSNAKRSHLKAQRKLPADDQNADGNASSILGLEKAAKMAARIISGPGEQNIAVLEAGGFDIHQDQGTSTGPLARKLAALSGAIEAIAFEMANDWDNTTIVVSTEFGRSVAPNNDGGTDNGHAGLTMLIGGAVRGGKFIGGWPGLEKNQLGARGGVKPTVDIRSIYKAILEEHLKISPSIIENEIFPNSADARALIGLIDTLS